MKLVFAHLPDLVKPEMERLVATWLRFLPRWVATLEVAYDATDTTSYASISADFVQRTALLSLCPKIFDLTERERDLTFLHELAHALHSPVDTAVAQILETAMPQRSAEQVYEDAVEGFVNDFAALAWEVDRGA